MSLGEEWELKRTEIEREDIAYEDSSYRRVAGNVADCIVEEDRDRYKRIERSNFVADADEYLYLNRNPLYGSFAVDRSVLLKVMRAGDFLFRAMVPRRSEAAKEEMPELVSPVYL